MREEMALEEEEEGVTIMMMALLQIEDQMDYLAIKKDMLY